MKYSFYLVALLCLLMAGCGGCDGCSGLRGCSGLFGCAAGSDEKQGADADAQEEIAYDPSKDMSIQEFNLEQRKKMATRRFPGDTLDLMEHVIKSYPKGTYLVDCDRTYTLNIPQSAVIYKNQPDGTYILALIAKSKVDDERLIEQKNLIGFDASFIDLDSTELGTAFFFLTLFKYESGTFSMVWESSVPTHGGFNRITWENWPVKRIPYIRVNFHYAQGSGHIDYNYFLIDGLLKPPHLLMTYEGINIKRTMANLNSDSIPDYFEYVYVDTGLELIQPDSVGFIWKDTAYFNIHNRRQWRKY